MSDAGSIMNPCRATYAKARIKLSTLCKTPRPLPAKLCQPLHAKLSGITEVRLAHDDNTYRVYVTLKCPWIIMVLDAGIKKSTEGKNIPTWQQERLETRYKKAREYWTGHDPELKADYNKRKTRREAFAKENGR